MGGVTWVGLDESESYLKNLRRKIPGALNRATMQEAHLLRRIITTGLRDQSPGGKPIKPLSVTTRMLRGLPSAGSAKRKPKLSESARSLKSAGFSSPAKKKRKSRAKRRVKLGSSKALINRGDLLRSVHVKKVSAGSYTVGVHRGTRGAKSGKEMSDLAALHEGGSKKYTITVTEKMRKFSMFLFMMGVILAPWRKGQKLKKQTPARPFLMPGYEQWYPGSEARFNFTVANELRSV